MRISDKNKNIIFNNWKRLKFLLITSLISNLLLFYIYYKNLSIHSFIRWSIFEILFFIFLFYILQPTIILENQNIKKCIFVRSISDSGICSALVDSISFSISAKALNAFSNYGIIMLLGIPFSFLIEILYKPYKRMVTNN